MNLHFDTTIAEQYKSPSQKIRIMSEAWAANNLYCPCCGNPKIQQLSNNRPVADFECEKCHRIFELKSKKEKIGEKIVAGAYSTMVQRINDITNPELLILQYSQDYTVVNLILIPKFFLTPNLIEKRKPLSRSARRAGWVGCNILYHDIPEQGKIPIVLNRSTTNAEQVVNTYSRIKTLQTPNIELRGWLMDVLNCVNSVQNKEFTLNEIYRFKDKLTGKYPENHNIEAKIRQQLQLLRDKSFIEFCGRGQYRKLS